MASCWPGVNIVTIEMASGLILTFPQFATSLGTALSEFNILEQGLVDLSKDKRSKVATSSLDHVNEQALEEVLPNLTESQRLSR